MIIYLTLQEVKKELRKKLELAKTYHDGEVSEIRFNYEDAIRRFREDHAHRLFILFLKTITIRTNLNGPLKNDIEFINQYYNVELKLEGKS